MPISLRAALLLACSTLFVLLSFAACGGTPVMDTDGDGVPDSTATPTATITPTVTLARPTPAPFPTSNVVNLNMGIPLQTIMDLPAGWGLDIAVHPTENWAAVCFFNRAFDGPFRAWYRVFEPSRRSWTDAQQIDGKEASNGFDRWSSSKVAISGDGTVHALFGPADGASGDRWGNYPGWSSAEGLHYRRSTDKGRTWSPPISREQCLNLGFDASRNGWVAALMLCHWNASSTPPDLDQPQGQATPTSEPATGETPAAELWLMRRAPDGTWLDAVPLPLSHEGFLFGDLVLLEEGTTAVAVAAVVDSDGAVNGLRYPLPDGPLSVTHREFPDDITPWYPFGVKYYRSTDQTDPATGARVSLPSATFTWNGWERAQVIAFHTFDAGQTWIGPEIVVDHGAVEQSMPIRTPSAVYDPDADRLVVIWLDNVGSASSSHYGAWSVPGSGVWHLVGSDGQLGTGALEATMSVTAQSANVGTFWLAWHEKNGTIRARTMRVRDIVPDEEYQRGGD